jgi:hypothetical protein
MNSIQNKSFVLRKKILVFLFVCVFTFAPFTAAKTQAFWPDFLGNGFGSMMTMMLENIKGILLGAAKKAAISALQKQMTSMLGGKGSGGKSSSGKSGSSASGGAMFITDWSAFLTKQPQANANVFINDYISKSTGGRGSSTSYIPAGGEGVGGNGGYTAQLKQTATSVTSGQPTKMNITYQGNPSAMFSGSSGASAFKNLNLFLSGDNPKPAAALAASKAYDANLTEEKKIAETKANAGSGFIGKEVNGVTVTPGSVIKDQTSKVQNMGLDVLANANNLPEVISAAVSQIISQTMTQGLGNVMATVTKETSTSSKQKAQQNSAVQNNGPGVLYNQISGAATSAIK